MERKTFDLIERTAIEKMSQYMQMGGFTPEVVADLEQCLRCIEVGRGLAKIAVHFPDFEISCTATLDAACRWVYEVSFFDKY